MIFFSRSRNRPFHLGSFPLETLPNDDSVAAIEAEAPRRAAPVCRADSVPLADVADRYRSVLAQFADGESAPALAPVPDDLERRAADIKGLAYFMDAAQVGICRIPDNAWLDGSERSAHDVAIVLLIEDGKIPDADNLAREWVEPAVRAVSDQAHGFLGQSAHHGP